MRNTLALLAAVVLIVLVLGYFLNWYSLVGVENNTGSTRLQIDLNTSKIKSDINKGKEKLKDTIEDIQEATNDANPPANLPTAPSKAGEKVFRF
jgi:cytoskeletal protein RodZ